MSYLMIDGAQGEGGGQVLRTALTLSALTQQPIELINIRAKRSKPGLLRQHLTSVLAAKKVCNATVEGAELGSDHIRFYPREIKSGNYHFAISTAGSTVLVCQTILPILWLAQGHSTVTFEGGTHNGMSPSLCFLQRSYLPLLSKIGGKCWVSVSRFGFNPAGGGKWQLEVEPAESLKPLHLSESGSVYAAAMENCRLTALISQLPENIAQREISTARKILAWQGASEVVTEVESVGSGNSFQLSISSGTHENIFEVIGQLGTSAERVAKRCAGQVKKFIHSQAAVEEHLADQLLLPMALAGSGSYTTTKPSSHTLTNIDVINMFLGVNIAVEQQSQNLWKLKVG